MGGRSGSLAPQMWGDGQCGVMCCLSCLVNYCVQAIEREPVRRSLQDGRKHSRVGWLSDVTKKRLT